jgi:hypothetical protein
MAAAHVKLGVNCRMPGRLLRHGLTGHEFTQHSVINLAAQWARGAGSGHSRDKVLMGDAASHVGLPYGLCGQALARWWKCRAGAALVGRLAQISGGLA